MALRRAGSGNLTIAAIAPHLADVETAESKRPGMINKEGYSAHASNSASPTHRKRGARSRNAYVGGVCFRGRGFSHMELPQAIVWASQCLSVLNIQPYGILVPEEDAHFI